MEAVATAISAAAATTAAATGTVADVIDAAVALAAVEPVVDSVEATCFAAIAAGDIYHRACRYRCRPNLLRHFDLGILRPTLPDRLCV